MDTKGFDRVVLFPAPGRYMLRFGAMQDFQSVEPRIVTVHATEQREITVDFIPN